MPLLVAGVTAIAVVLAAVTPAWMVHRSSRRVEQRIGPGDISLSDRLSALEATLRDLAGWQRTWRTSDGHQADGIDSLMAHNELTNQLGKIGELVEQMRLSNVQASVAVRQAINALSMKVDLVQTALKNHVDWEESAKYPPDDMVSQLLRDVVALQRRIGEEETS